MVEISKRDWKLFQEKLPKWQEAYMDRLCREYVDIMTSEKKGSEKFWALEECIKHDRKAPGVILSPSKSDIHFSGDDSWKCNFKQPKKVRLTHLHRKYILNA